jgi:hypothetical protein
MPDLTNYRDSQVASLPPWLQADRAQSFVYVLALLKDAMVEGAKRALQQRFPTTCRNDALGFVGATFDLDRSFLIDDNHYRELLLAAWDIWALAGTEASVLSALVPLGISNAEILENGDWNVNDRPDMWWRMWVIVREPYLMAEGVNLAPPEDTSAGVEQWRGLVHAVKKWKPAHEYAFVIVVLEGELWGDPADPWHWGDGTVFGGADIRTEFS